MSRQAFRQRGAVIILCGLFMAQCAAPPTREIPPLDDDLRIDGTGIRLLLLFQGSTGAEESVLDNCFVFLRFRCDGSIAETTTKKWCSGSERWTIVARGTFAVTSASLDTLCGPSSEVSGRVCGTASCDTGQCQFSDSVACETMERGVNPFGGDWSP